MEDLTADEVKKWFLSEYPDETEEATKVNDSNSGSHQQDYTQYWHHNQGGSALPYDHPHPPPQNYHHHHHHNQLYHRQNHQNHPHLHQNQNQNQGAGGIADNHVHQNQGAGGIAANHVHQNQGAGGIAANHVHQNQGAGGIAANHVHLHQNQGAGGNYHSYSSNPQNHHQNGNGDAGIAATSTTPIPISSDIYKQKLPDTHAMNLSNIIYAKNGREIPPEEIKTIWKGIHSNMSAVASNWADEDESSHIGTIVQAQRRAHRNYIDVPSYVTDTKNAASLLESETEVKKMYESFTPNGSNINTAGMFLNRLVSLWVWLTLKIQKPQTSSDRLVTDFLNTFCADVGLPPNSLIFEGGNSKAKLGERLMKNASGKVRSFPGASTKETKDGDFWLNLFFWITGIPKLFLKGILGNIRVTLVSPPATSLKMKNEQVAKRDTDTYFMLSPSKRQHTVVMSKNLVFPPSMMRKDSAHSVKDFCFTFLLKLVISQLNTNVSGKRVFFIFVVYSYFFSSVLTSMIL